MFVAATKTISKNMDTILFSFLLHMVCCTHTVKTNPVSRNAIPVSGVKPKRGWYEFRLLLVLYLSLPTCPFRGRKNEYKAQRG